MAPLLRVVLLTMCLLTLATTASAECAWVLWEYKSRVTMIKGEDGLFRPQVDPQPTGPARAMSDRRECEGSIRLAMKNIASKVPAWQLEQVLEDGYIWKENEHTSIFTHWICLPDTVDPREVKGKPGQR